MLGALGALPSGAWAQGGYTVVGSPPSTPTAGTAAVIPTSGTQPGPTPDNPLLATTTTPYGGTATVTPVGGRLAPGVHRPEEYGGLTPGGGRLPPGLRRLRRIRSPRNIPVVAWPGFQMVPGGSRIFLASTSQPTITTTRPSPRVLVYRLERARIALFNNRRPLLTESFETPATRSFLRTVRGAVELVIELRADVEPRVSQEDGPPGLHFLYVDLPPWTGEVPRLFLPGGAQVPLARPGTPVVAAPVSGPAVVPIAVGGDSERPPILRR